MARKTFSVEAFKNKVNKMLATSTCSAAERDVMNMLLGDVLHETGNYEGYRHLRQEEIPAGHKPAIRYDDNGEMLPYPDRFVDCDDSRRHYI